MEIQHNAHTMDCNDPDLELKNWKLLNPIFVKCFWWESIRLWVWALVSNLIPDCGIFGCAKTMLHLNVKPTAAVLHILSLLSDLDYLPDDHETSSEWKLKGHIYFAFRCWPAGKTCEDAVQAAVEQQYLSPAPVPAHRMEIFYNLAAESARESLKLQFQGYVQAKSSSRQQWRKWIAVLEWEKILWA